MTHRSDRVAHSDTRLRTHLCMALSAALLLPAMDAAAGGFRPTGYSSNDPYYQYDIYEWRDDPNRQKSLPAAANCNENTAPLVVLFHGGDGVDAGDTILLRDMPPLAASLAKACVRFVAIQGRSPITSWLVRSDKAFLFTDQLAARMTGALGKAVELYPNTTNVVLFSGSFGGVTAAALMRNNVDYYTNDAYPGWNKLDRFVFNVPAGDVCNPSPKVDFTGAYTDPSWIVCDRTKGLLKDIFTRKYLPEPENSGYISRPFSSTQASALLSKAEVHLLVGSNDPVAGVGYAAWGMENYLSTVGLTAYSAGSTYDPAQAPLLTPRIYRMTHTVVTGPAHGNLWTYNDNVRIGLCQFMARSFRNAGSTTDDRDTRNMTDAKLIAACK